MDSPTYTVEPFCRNMAWIDLLLLTNHKEGFLRVRGILVRVLPGQIGHSADSLATRWRWSRGKVLRFLNELENSQQIAQQKSKVITLITVCNWSEYQKRDTTDSTTNDTTDDTTDSTTNGQQTVQQTDTNKNVKKKKNVKKEKKETASASASVPNPFSEKFDAFCQYRKFAVEPPSATKNTGLKKIKEFFITQVPPDALNPEDVAFEMWYTVLKNFDNWEPFYQKQVKLIQIASNLPNIIATINGAGTKNPVNNGSGQVAAQAMAAVARRYQERQSEAANSSATAEPVS